MSPSLKALRTSCAIVLAAVAARSYAIPAPTPLSPVVRTGGSSCGKRQRDDPRRSRLTAASSTTAPPNETSSAGALKLF